MISSKKLTASLAAAAVVASLGLSAINNAVADEFHMKSHKSWYDDRQGHKGHMCDSKYGKSAKSGAFSDYTMYRIEMHLDFTPEQEAKWENVKTAVKSNRKAMETLRADMKNDDKPENAPARLAVMEKFLAARLDAVQKMGPAIDDLYSSLDDEQKETFNKLTSRHKRHS